ncbi:MAG: hypothetical protein V1742_03535 [Pseudomonadota bacterium]
MNLAHNIRQGARYYPDKISLIFGHQAFTYREVDARANLVISYKAPKKVVFVDDLPRTPPGKLLKRELRKYLF